MQYIIIPLSIISLIIIILIITANYQINKIFIKGKKKLFEIKEKEETEEQKQIKEKRKIWFENSQKDIYTNSIDNLKIHAHLIENNKSNIYIIMMHFYEGRGSYMKYFAEKFFNMGFNVIAADLRTHGDSDGSIYSLGYFERLDVLAWIEYINNNYKDSKIILYGVSMGANSVMMCSNENIADNVKCIIEDAGFSNAKKQFNSKLNNVSKLLFIPVLELISIILKIRFGFSLKNIDIVKAVSSSKLPILFIHGNKDKLINFKMAYELYNACKSEKEKLIIENGEHISAVFQNEDLYWNTIKNFINKYI